MLTLIDKLQTFISRQFVVSYFVPLLVFASLNTVLLAWQFPMLRQWVPEQFDGLKGFYAIPVLMAVAIVAYIFASVNMYLRQVLEGRRLPAFIRRDWIEGQQHVRDVKDRRLQDARRERFDLPSQKPVWRKRLVEASDQGHASPDPNASYDANHPAAKAIEQLEEKRKNVKIITTREIEDAVAGLESVLEKVDRGQNIVLQADYRKLMQIADYAEELANIEFSDALVDLERCFGEEVRATRMGNVAAALDSYGKTRYSIDLAVYWSRIQLVIQDKKEVYGALVDAKCQLDFLVMCCWLCIITSAAWLVGMQWLPFSWILYLLVLIVLPLAARLFYELAVENYSALADLIRTIVDLFRFQLLKSLHIAAPAGIRQERAMWAALGELTSGSTGVEISYQHDGT